jgi:hypothetical protein
MENKLLPFLFALIFIFLANDANAQIAFTNSNTQILSTNNYSGLCMGVVDMNNDGLDDIIQLSQGKTLKIQYQRAGNTFTTLTVGDVSTESQWGMAIADVDNNGFNDVVCGASYDGMKVYIANATGTAFTRVNLSGASIFTQNVNFADINNDGFVDIWACHDDGAAPTWINNQDNTFTVNYTYINTNLPNGSDNSGNYGSLFTDYDNDGDMDLYVAKCRQGVNDPTDPRRINILFRNNGNGTYTEAASAANLAINEQSWTASFEDIDNDADMDLMITNHSNRSQIFENNGSGVFTDITTATGFNYTDYAMQGMMFDFDNDGYVDILCASGGGTGHKMWRNNGNKTFSAVSSVFDNKIMESFAVGDLNHDGFLDVYAGYGDVYVTPTNVADIAWLNNTNNNHWLAISLTGVQSNKNGIGARITIYRNGQKQIREVRSGESYGICNTFTKHFGLGSNNAMIDSVVVNWPSGIRTVTNNVNVDQFVNIPEIQCNLNANVIANGSLTFCNGQNVQLSAENAGLSYLWNNGATTQSITVTQSGNYYVDITSGGCTQRSQQFNVVVDPVQNPIIDAPSDLTICGGNTIQLSYAPKTGVNSFQWNTGETTPIINVTQGGTYTVTVQGLCSSFTSPSVQIEQLSPNPPVSNNVTIPINTSAELNATGTNITWYDAPTGGNIVGTGNTLTTPILNAETTYYAQDLNSVQGAETITGKTFDASGAFNSNQYNGQTLFDVFDNVTLKEVTVFTDIAGLRIIELRNTSGTVLQSYSANITQLNQQVILPLNFALTPGSYILTTNDAQNQSITASINPRFRRSNTGVTYPYVLQNKISINNSNIGAQYYYYFYDWKIKEADISCTSLLTPVTVFINNTTTGLTNTYVGKTFISPNPSNGLINLNIESINNDKVEITLVSISGKVIFNANYTIKQGENIIPLDFQHLSKGIYSIKISTINGSNVNKLIIE